MFPSCGSSSEALVFWLTGSAGLSPLLQTCTPPGARARTHTYTLTAAAPPTEKEQERWGTGSKNAPGGEGRWFLWRVQISLLLWASPSAQ